MSRAPQAWLSSAREGLLHVGRRPLRAGLNAATCAVAIAVTVNVISLSYGLDADVRRDISRFGRLTVDVGRAPLIRPGAARPPFGPAEARRIEQATAGLPVRLVPVRQAAAAASGDAALSRASVVAVGTDYPATLDIPFVAGRWLLASERGTSACVLDRSAASALFPALAPGEVLGRMVRLSGTLAGEPRVVGLLEDPLTYRALFEEFDEGRGSRTLVGALLSFRNVYLPEDALPSDDLSSVGVVCPDEEVLAEAARRLREVWPSPPGAPIVVFVRKEWMDALGGSSQTAAMVGNLVWILVVLVAAIMISTLNLITIRERYDEIAVRRCEGARRLHLGVQIAVEGVAVAVVGGLAGLPLGYLGAAALRGIVHFPFRFEAPYAAAAAGIAAGLGLLASLVPARRAATLQPAAVLSRRLL